MDDVKLPGGISVWVNDILQASVDMDIQFWRT
jgi:hypothetical protein